MFYSTHTPVVFIHIPRTGGDSLTQTWSGLDHMSKDVARYKHATASQIRELIGEDIWNRAFRFTIIRDPWEIVCSLWRLILGAPLDLGSTLWRTHIRNWRQKSFGEFVGFQLRCLQKGGYLRTYVSEQKVHVFKHVKDAHQKMVELMGEEFELQYTNRSQPDIPVDESFRQQVYDYCWGDVEFLKHKVTRLRRRLSQLVGSAILWGSSIGRAPDR